MPDLNGLEMARILGPEARIVFTTAFEQYAVDEYKVNALDYLLKPVSYPEFMQTVEKAVRWFSRQDSRQESIFVKSDYKLEIEAIDRGRIVIGNSSIPVGDNYKEGFQKSIGIEA